MKSVMIALGVLLTSIVVLAMPILFVCSLYESWPGFIKTLLFLSMVGDLLLISAGVLNSIDDFE